MKQLFHVNHILILVLFCGSICFFLSCESSDPVSPDPEEQESPEWLLTEVVKYQPGEMHNPEAIFTISYDSLHKPVNVVEQTTTDGLISYVNKTLVYNDKKQLIEIRNTYDDNWSKYFEYDDEGRLIHAKINGNPSETFYTYNDNNIVGEYLIGPFDPNRPADTTRIVYTYDANNNLSDLERTYIKGGDGILVNTIAEFSEYDQYPNPYSSVNLGDLHVLEIFSGFYKRKPTLIGEIPFLSANNALSLNTVTTSYYGDEPRVNESSFDFEYTYSENGLVTQEILHDHRIGESLITDYKYVHIDEIK